MNENTITIKSELVEDWQLLRPVSLMIVAILVIYGLVAMTHNIIRMYKENHNK